jgi:hypothetical protein
MIGCDLMGDLLNIAAWFVRYVTRAPPAAIAAVVCGCGFSVSGSSAPMIDGARPVDADEERPRWAISAINDGSASTVTVHPLVGTRFSSTCTGQLAPGAQAIRALLPHPSLPLVYALEGGFHAIHPGCSSSTWVGMPNVGGGRPIQRIALDPATGVGFFTADGAGAIGVYRFTIASDGAPTVTSAANATSQGGALALDATGSRLLIAGPSITSSYSLIGENHDLPSTYETAGGCMQPIDLLLTGDKALLFCKDVAEVRRYDRDPFVAEANAGELGAVSQVLALPNDRAIAGRLFPPDLSILDLAAGSPTLIAGPSLETAVSAMAVSREGDLVVTARALDTTRSELAIWTISGSLLMLADTQTIEGTVSALALMPPAT